MVNPYLTDEKSWFLTGKSMKMKKFENVIKKYKAVSKFTVPIYDTRIFVNVNNRDYVDEQLTAMELGLV